MVHFCFLPLCSHLPPLLLLVFSLLTPFSLLVCSLYLGTKCQCVKCFLCVAAMPSSLITVALSLLGYPQSTRSSSCYRGYSFRLLATFGRCDGTSTATFLSHFSFFICELYLLLSVALLVVIYSNSLSCFSFVFALFQGFRQSPYVHGMAWSTNWLSTVF